MPISIVRTSANIEESTSGVTTYSTAFDCTGADYLVVFVADLTGDTVTSVEYASTAMTQADKITRSPNEGSLHIYAYTLANPTTGSNNITVTRTGTVATIDLVGYALSAGSGAAVNATGKANGGGVPGTTLDVSLTTTVDGCGILGWWVMDNGSITAGSNLTLDATGGAGNRAALGSFRASTFPQATAGSFTGTGNGGFNSSRGGILIAISPGSPVSKILRPNRIRPYAFSPGRAR
jgi:hypothetical protein